MLISIWGCEDYYTPELDDISNTLVVEAILTDKPGYVTVKISRSIPFEKRSTFYGEAGAQVYIYDTDGTNYQFTEGNKGYYTSNDSVFTKTGNKYILKIITEDGEVFKSLPEEMMAPNQIENVSFENSILKEVNYNYWGEPIVKDYDGIAISVLPSKPENPQVGFLYQWNSLVNYYVFTQDLPMEYEYFCWKKMHNEQIYVYDYNEEETANQLILDDLHFLSNYRLSPLPIDSTRFEGTIENQISTSFYYELKQYTITKEGADFWKSVKSQSEANGKLFDPVEEELTTNIYCTSNPDIQAFGYFNTASYTEKIIAVRMQSYKILEYYDIELLPQPEKSEDCEEVVPHEFWIY